MSLFSWNFNHRFLKTLLCSSLHHGFCPSSPPAFIDLYVPLLLQLKASLSINPPLLRPSLWLSMLLFFCSVYSTVALNPSSLPALQMDLCNPSVPPALFMIFHIHFQSRISSLLFSCFFHSLPLLPHLFCSHNHDYSPLFSPVSIMAFLTLLSCSHNHDFPPFSSPIQSWLSSPFCPAAAIMTFLPSLLLF